MFPAVRFYSDILRHKSLFITKVLSQIPFIHVKIPKNKVCVRMYVQLRTLHYNILCQYVTIYIDE